MSEKDLNRSAALSPETLGLINETTATAVQKAVEAVFAGFAPMLREIALTPEKIREINRPYEDPAKLARELRESLKSKKDEAEIVRLTKERRDACPHTYPNGLSAINLCHNNPDRQPRGICVICGDWIHPKEWRIGPPTAEHPNGHAYLVEPHKDYRIVMVREMRS